MRVQQLALAVILATITVMGAGWTSSAIEVGELQAVSAGGPPYVFRVPLTLPRGHQAQVPAVLIRRPSDALSVVTPNLLELRLHALADVEVEISHAGQTLNRLFPVAELQAARLAWDRHQTAQAKAQEPSRLASLSRQASRPHQAWAPVDSGGAQPALPYTAQAQLDPRSSAVGQVESAGQGAMIREAQPVPQATVWAAERLELEREVHLLRDEIHRLVGQAVPWSPVSAPPSRPETNLTAVVGVALGGLFAAGLVSLFTGLLMQRHAFERERLRWRLVAATLARAQLMLPQPRPPLVPPAAYAEWSSVIAAGSNEPMPEMRRPRLLSKRSRRIWIRPSLRGEGGRPSRALGDMPSRMPAADHGGAPSAALLEALDAVRRELIDLQRRLPPATQADGHNAGSG
jgi:hypothetical protein